MTSLLKKLFTGLCPNTALYASELSHSIMLPFNSAHAFIGIFLDFFMAFSLAKLLWYLVFWTLPNHLITKNNLGTESQATPQGLTRASLCRWATAILAASCLLCLLCTTLSSLKIRTFLNWFITDFITILQRVRKSTSKKGLRPCWWTMNIHTHWKAQQNGAPVFFDDSDSQIFHPSSDTRHVPIARVPTPLSWHVVPNCLVHSMSYMSYFYR